MSAIGLYTGVMGLIYLAVIASVLVVFFRLARRVERMSGDLARIRELLERGEDDVPGMKVI